MSQILWVLIAIYKATESKVLDRKGRDSYKTKSTRAYNLHSLLFVIIEVNAEHEAVHRHV